MENQKKISLKHGWVLWRLCNVAAVCYDENIKKVQFSMLNVIYGKESSAELVLQE